MFFIKIMSGEKFSVNQSVYEAIMKADKGIFIPRLAVFINKSFIAAAYPESAAAEIEVRKPQQTGILHDGTRAKNYFGAWVDADNQVPDDKGNYQPVRLDPAYYPEVARDCVPTEAEFEKIRHLPPAERLEIILQGSAEPRKISGGAESIKEILGKLSS
jgi:hypothetical protein